MAAAAGSGGTARPGASTAKIVSGSSKPSRRWGPSSTRPTSLGRSALASRAVVAERITCPASARARTRATRLRVAPAKLSSTATASPVWTPQCTCTRPPARARWRSTPACTASLARWKTDIVASPWMTSPMRRPSWRSTARSTTSRCSASRPGAASGSSCHSRVEATTSVARKVTTPVGKGSLSQPARSSSTSSPGVAVRCAGSVASPRRSACSSRAARSWSTSSQAGRMPDGGCPVSRAKAVAARPYTSAARVGTAPAATSGAR